MSHFAKLGCLLILLLSGTPIRALAQLSTTPSSGSSAGCPASNQNAIQTSNRKKMKTILKENQHPTVNLSCRLTSPELQERKRTVMASLQKQVLEQKELPNGYAYRFKGADATLDELITFLKTERKCCGFFEFGILLQSDENVWLELTGPEGAKDFIEAEIELKPAISGKNE